jgi:hypothetical protein
MYIKKSALAMQIADHQLNYLEGKPSKFIQVVSRVGQRKAPVESFWSDELTVRWMSVAGVIAPLVSSKSVRSKVGPSTINAAAVGWKMQRE